MEKTKRFYTFDGEHHVVTFNSSEEKWFISWVVLKRKLRLSLINIRELIKEVNYWRERTYELEKTIKDLKETIKSRGVSEIERKEAESRSKMIEEFNKKNNKGRNYKKRRKK